jgi:CheY-like chemotaxis protein
MAVVLVVEDQEQVRVLAQSILDEGGHKTLSASTTDEALALIQTGQQIDLLFTDIELSRDVEAGLVHPGLELAQEAVKLRPDLRVLYTTGQAVTDGMKALFVEGAEFLPKPYDVQGLSTRIDDMIGERQRFAGKR